MEATPVPILVVLGMLVGAVLEAEHGSAAGRSSFAGNICLLLNCLSTPVYLIVSRPLLRRVA